MAVVLWGGDVRAKRLPDQSGEGRPGPKTLLLLLLKILFLASTAAHLIFHSHLWPYVWEGALAAAGPEAERQKRISVFPRILLWSFTKVSWGISWIILKKKVKKTKHKNSSLAGVFFSQWWGQIQNIVQPQNMFSLSFRPSQMSSGSGNLTASLHLIDIWLPLQERILREHSCGLC